MLKYLLLGREGSGCEFFRKLLEKNKLKVARSFTTREQRDANDNMHYFISDEERGKIENRLFETEHNGNIYFYTREEIEECEIIPIDPQNVKEICKCFPDTAFRFIEIMASNEDRIKHAVAEAEDKITAEEDFIAMCEEENEAFCEFEDAAYNMNLNINNLLVGHIANNDFTENADIFSWVDKIKDNMRVFKRVCAIVETLGKEKMLIHNEETKKYTLYVQPTETKSDTAGDTSEDIEVQLSLDRMAEQVILDPNGMWHIMTAWLSLKRIDIM